LDNIYVDTFVDTIRQHVILLMCLH
jgi:hypothetical protein